MKSALRTAAETGLILVALLVWTLVLLSIIPQRAHAQESAAKSAVWTPFQYGIVTDSARTFLEQAWDTRNPTQVERGYCIEPTDVQIDTASDKSSVRWAIHHITIPDSLGIATPYANEVHCSGTAIASGHVHTPTTCVRALNDPVGRHVKSCVIGGEEAYICTVDEWDRHEATKNKDAFMFVQCDRSAIVFFWPGKRG